MNTVVSTSEVILREDEAGVLRIGLTSVSLDSVIIAFNQGSIAEEIVFDYPTLNLSDVYAAISHYCKTKKKLMFIRQTANCNAMIIAKNSNHDLAQTASAHVF